MQYGDFVFCAMDQVVNQAAKTHYMSGGQSACRWCCVCLSGLRSEGHNMANRRRLGSCTHRVSRSSPLPLPTTPRDCCWLRFVTITPSSSSSTKLLYGGKGGRKRKDAVDLVMDVPEGDFEVPLGTAAVRRGGSDVTILANMLMVHPPWLPPINWPTRGLTPR